MFSSSARARPVWPLVLAILAALVAGLLIGGHPSWLPSPLRSVFVDESSAERRAGDVLSLLSHDYYRPVNTNKLLNTGLQAAVASLRDPYSHYYPPTEYHSFLNETNPHLSGIGVDIAQTTKGLQILEVFPGKPAALAGLRAGEVITRVGSVSLAGRSQDFATHLIEGPAGTRVTLTVSLHGRSHTVVVTRRNIVVPVAASVLLHYRGRRLGALQFSSFTHGSAAELRGQVQKMLHDRAAGLILDLRGNGGGLLAEAIKVASIFIPDGTIVTTRGRSQPTIVYTATGSALAPRIPMVVLVDRGTASSAEIVTGALKDRGRATVVGTHTYGKGVFQEIQEVPGGGALDITVGEYFTPDGRNLGGGGVRQGVGITPDVYVSPRPQGSVDRALLTAERVLAAKLR
jgi:carboxyl-terminal processing protease